MDAQKERGAGTVLGLCAALRDRIKSELSSTRLLADGPHELYIQPKVVNGYLAPKPPKRGDCEPEYPFVIVRPRKGALNEHGEYKVRIQLIVGTFSQEADGHEYAILVFERMVRALQENPILDKRYTLDYPVTWALFDEQQYPFWQVVGEVSYLVPAPLPNTITGVL